MSNPYPEITVDEASRALAEYYVVDVREPNEYTGELGHIDGSRLLPLGELMERVEAGDDRDALFAEAGDRPLLMVCRSGNRSGKACARLAEVGITDASNLQGGMLEWNRVGLPTVSNESPATE